MRQSWVKSSAKESGTKKFLDSLPELPRKGKIKPGLYVNCEIDESELDGGIDWPDVGVAVVYAMLQDGKKNGEVRAYNRRLFGFPQMNMMR